MTEEESKKALFELTKEYMSHTKKEESIIFLQAHIFYKL